MSQILDHALVAAAVFGALGYFIARIVRSRSGKGCGAGCGCAPKHDELRR